jgi:hypothetical protein
VVVLLAIENIRREQKQQEGREFLSLKEYNQDYYLVYVRMKKG